MSDIKFNRMTLEEATQMQDMFNWVAENEVFENFSLDSFKQVNNIEKCTYLMYEITTILMINGKWSTTRDTGYTLTEAMTKFSVTYAEAIK